VFAVAEEAAHTATVALFEIRRANWPPL
jgi:hypothetical protein